MAPKQRQRSYVLSEYQKACAEAHHHGELRYWSDASVTIISCQRCDTEVLVAKGLSPHKAATLKQVRRGARRPQMLMEPDAIEAEYEVARVISKRVREAGPEYRIRWRG